MCTSKNYSKNENRKIGVFPGELLGSTGIQDTSLIPSVQSLPSSTGPPAVYLREKNWLREHARLRSLTDPLFSLTTSATPFKYIAIETEKSCQKIRPRLEGFGFSFALRSPPCTRCLDPRSRFLIPAACVWGSRPHSHCSTHYCILILSSTNTSRRTLSKMLRVAAAAARGAKRWGAR